ELRRARLAPRYRPLDRRGDSRARARTAFSDPRWQRAAGALALLRRAGPLVGELRGAAALGALGALHPARPGRWVHPGDHGSRRDGVRAEEAPLQPLPARGEVPRAAPRAAARAA